MGRVAPPDPSIANAAGFKLFRATSSGDRCQKVRGFLRSACGSTEALSSRTEGPPNTPLCTHSVLATSNADDRQSCEGTWKNAK
jgi:hypothetical protein